MRFIHTTVIRVVLAALVTLLGGCIELIPRGVEENIVIHRDGKIEVTYEGTFNDLRDLAKAVAADKGEKVPNDADFRTSALHLLKDQLDITEVKVLSPGLYRLRWHDEGTLKENRLPKLLDHYGSDKIPRLLQASSYRELSPSAFSIETIKQDDPNEDSSLPPGTRTAKVLQGYLDHFKGKVSVRVDPSMVLKHNAKSVTTKRDGSLLLQWALSMPMTEGVELLVTLDKRDFPTFKLMSSPQGSSCKELIGSDCKCGPFKIVDYMGDPQINAPYEIEGPQGVQQACTNAEGKTIAIESPVTGPCVVRLLPKNEPVPDCAAGGKSQPATAGDS